MARHEQEGAPMVRGGARRRLLVVLGLFVGFLLEFWLLALLSRLVGARALARFRQGLFRRQAARFKRRALDLGGLLIKLGQFLSARVDLLPPEYTDTLTSLQDQANRVPWREMQGVLADLDRPVGDVFATLNEEPVAAASFAQVHEGTLLSGEHVAVKLQRPGIRDLVEVDLRAVAWFLTVLERFTSLGRTMDLWAVYDEFAETTRAELDFAREAENARAFRQNLRRLEFVHVPVVYAEASQGRVLVMEFVEAIRISDHAGLEAAGVDCHEVAVQLVQTYMQMVLEDGFFHADPHPGNLFVRADGQIALVDFGMVGRITKEQLSELRKLFIAVAAHREDEIVEAFDRLGFLRPGADRSAVRRAVSLVLERFYRGTLKELYEIDPHALAFELQELIRRQPFQVPANVAFLGRALSILVGVSTGLDPSLNLVALFEPYARSLSAGEGGSDVLSEGLNRLRRSLTALLALPELALSAYQSRPDRTAHDRDLAILAGQQVQAQRALAAAVYQVGLGALSIVLWSRHMTLLGDVAAATAILSYLLSHVRFRM